LVVLYHLWPNRLTGGYVGVDVFFVISGFLITSHLHREITKTGSVSLAQFWARRIRRLLPASLLVLGICLVAVVLWVPATQWSVTARQEMASALYVQNWTLAADSVNYMALGNVPTVVQHYWSLSAEEQFYLVWPLLLLLCTLPGRRKSASASSAVRWATGAIAAVGVASLAWSIVMTRSNPSAAYFITPTRVWEFAAGAVLALVGTRWLGNRRVAAALAVVGLGAVLFAGFAFTDQTAFPGWVALLPVAGAAAVIAGARSGHGVGKVLATPPMRFVGDISYSVYLLHWPLIVIWPHVTGVSLRTRDKLAIGVLSLGLAWLSKTFVEDPVRQGRFLAARPWRAFAFAALGMVVVVGAAAGVNHALARRAAGIPIASVQDPCYGPGALSGGCGSPVGTGPFAVPPEVVSLQNGTPTYPGCMADGNHDQLVSCTLGSTSDTPDRVVALVGDSHAMQWYPAFDAIGKERNWRVITYTKGSCPFTSSLRFFVGEKTDVDRLSCARWNPVVEQRLLDDKQISFVFTAAFSTTYTWGAPDGQTMADPRTDGFVESWQRLLDAGKQVFAISDIPRTSGTSVPDCLAAHPDDRLACDVPRAQALPGSALVAASAALPSVHVLDLSDDFCDATTCYPAVGNVIVYRDFSHLSAEYARALAPDLDKAIGAAIKG
jgi:peptidoglycan/LPS O-acetylase OafA/YrhL